MKTLGRRRWKKWAGYHQQARVDNAFFRYKAILGDAYVREVRLVGTSRRAWRAVS